MGAWAGNCYRTTLQDTQAETQAILSTLSPDGGPFQNNMLTQIVFISAKQHLQRPEEGAVSQTTETPGTDGVKPLSMAHPLTEPTAAPAVNLKIYQAWLSKDSEEFSQEYAEINMPMPGDSGL